MAKTLALISWWKSNRPIGCSMQVNCGVGIAPLFQSTSKRMPPFLKLIAVLAWRTCMKVRETLLKLKQSFKDPYHRLSSWKGNNCCIWRGISCDETNGHVVKLNLRAPWASLLREERKSLVASVLNSCLLQFTYLEHLDLSGNNFQYSPIPQIFGSMKQLRYLNISNSRFNDQGSPWALTVHNVQWISNLSSLQHLGMAGICLANAFSGIEKGLLLMFGNMCYLRSLDISYNQLPGEQIGKYRNLSGCFGHDLEALNLDYARISGYVPNWLGMLGNLKHVHLSHNQLNGTVPESLGQLSNLETLDLSYDSLEAAICEVHFASLSKLKTLSIGSTGLTIKIKSDWIPPFQLEYIEMESCKFGTQIPQWLQTQSKATTLLLSNASIWGTLPKWMKDMNLNELDLSHNQIKVTLPRFPSNLKLIDLSGNSISGVPPGKDGCSSHAMGHLCWLTWLDLSNNKLSGQLSLALKNCTSLRFLDVGENALSGNVPKWIGDTFGYLRILRLWGNKFNGSIPWQLCQLSTDLRSWILLKTIYKEGYLTVYLESYKTMLWWEKEHLNEVIKGRYLEYTKTLQFLVSRDLSMNNLEGVIPEELTHLTSLTALNLSQNQLSGKIPGKIGELESLESLDLFVNQLSGMILSSITKLSALSLSYSNFSGKIPKGNQLQTLDDPSIYAGNALFAEMLG
ncbi:hypothetical protein GOBAR_AA17216 [Gossypium barbadense]|uniref:Leucine-rich repeat-containing N-terminal plant-type domain-containing protein n=1 Tax=Gossypium barbadense TaxID=3634 RepID=A0A2P5XJF4_GOSBA|nr:hypothetical protein GOBAR_AA17216 [Gossypium barbadense]